jgi:glycerol kinase
LPVLLPGVVVAPVSGSLVLALDQGTTSSRAILFDSHGGVLGVRQREFQQHYPRPGWVEHDALEIWSSQSGVMAELLAAHGVSPRDVAAIGITNQRETTVLWDRATLQPVAPAIVWQDRRTAAAVERVAAQAGTEALVQERSGLLLDAYFSASKLAWLLEHIPGARARAERGELAFGTVDSWLIARLTGGEVHVTDVSNASRTMLMNVHTLDWDEQLLELWGIPRSLLPRIVRSSGVVGHVADRSLGAGIAIAGIAGDQQAATFGQACFTPGQAKATYGTGAFLVLHTGEVPIPSHHRLLTTVAWQRGERANYALEGSIFMAGATVQWLRDGLKVIRSSEEVEALAASVPDTGDVVLVPAFAGLGAPHWDPYARAAIFGMTRGTHTGHIARAALESIAFQVADVIDAMAADAGAPLTELRVDGGAARNNLLMQDQADILGVPVVRPAVTETTALGAAYLAGLATGVWTSEAEVAAQWREERRFEPQGERALVEHRRGRWREAVARAKNWSERE